MQPIIDAIFDSPPPSPPSPPSPLPPLLSPQFIANEEQQIIEDIHLEHGVKDGREYSRYTSGHQSLNIVRFKIGLQKFISINSNVLPFNAFGKLRQISPLNTPNSSSSSGVVLTFASANIVLHNCNVNLCIRAFSEI